PRVAAETGMSRHRGHGQRVQRLQQQRPDPADEHGRVPVHAADRAPFREPALAARVDHLAARRALRPGHPIEDGGADPSADAADATPTITSAMTAHSLIISRPAWTLRAVHGCRFGRAAALALTRRGGTARGGHSRVLA